MARVGEKESAAASQDYSTQSREAYNNTQGDINKFRQNVDTLKSGKMVAADPWLNPTYLANQNRLQSSALDAETNAGKAELARDNARTGGLNTGATTAAKAGLRLARMRLGDRLSAERGAEDWNKNIAYQGRMAEEPLSAARAEEPLYSTATGGRGSANKNLSDFGLSRQNFWQQFILNAQKNAESAGTMGAA